MKYKILLLLPLLLLLLSCNQGKINDLNEQVTRLQEQNQQLVEENNAIKAYVDEMAQLLTSVGEDLEKINQAEVDIRKLTEGAQPGTIQGDLKNKLGQIGQYIIDSKEKISDLEKKLSSTQHNIKGLNSMIADLKVKLADKETEVANLMSEIGVMQSDIDRMGLEIKEKDEKIADQETMISEANKRYYIYGNEGDLQVKGIIQKTGGFLFFGKVTKISPNLNLDDFTVIDATTDFDITIPYKMDKLKIVSPHEAGSYEMTSEDGQTIIRILNPDRFWASSKVLVVVVG